MGGQALRRALVALSLISCSLSGAARAQPSASTSGEFTAIQIATVDPEGLLREWAKPTPGVNLTTATRTRRNQPITTFIIFKGCRGDADGNCNVTVEFEVTTPAGGPYGERRSAEVWVNRPAPRPGVYQLSISGLGLGVEDKDALGAYTVRATTTDHVAGVSVRTEQVLTAVPD